MAQQSSHEYHNHEMRSIRLAVIAFCRARLDGAELELAVVVGGNSREAAWCASHCGIAGAAVHAIFVGAPDFQDRVGNSSAVAIKDAAADGNYFCVGAVTGGNQVVERPRAQADGEKR